MKFSDEVIILARNVFTVSEINKEVNKVLTQRENLINCWVTGEISNFKDHIQSGHWYFTIKDENSGLKAVMFRSKAARVSFSPQNGMKVLLLGSVRLYERDGSVQFYTEEIYPSGVGELYIAFEQLKNKLGAEGLFESERKKPIPRFPTRIGVVTSLTGAVIKDILSIAQRRNSKVTVVVIPAAVQGVSAPTEIAFAIQKANLLQDIDLLIVGRGGGSLEELWAFNTELVARAIASSTIPIVSAVGHEVDYTIADFVADLRAPTPSAAVELVVPLFDELQRIMENYEKKLLIQMEKVITRKRQLMKELMVKQTISKTNWRLEQSRQDLDNLTYRMRNALTGFLTDKNGILRLITAKLDLLSPLNTLARGYSITYLGDGRLLDKIEQVSVGDSIKVQLKDGTLECNAMKVRVDEKTDGW